MRTTISSRQLGNPDDVDTGDTRVSGVDPHWEQILSELLLLGDMLCKMDERLESMERRLRVQPSVDVEAGVSDGEYVDEPEDHHEDEDEE